MIDYEYKNLLLNGNTDRQILIEYDTGSLTNNEIPMDEISIEESICSEDYLVFGSCEASVLKFTANNVFEELKNKWLNVTITPRGAESNPFQIGNYKVYSDVPTADRTRRNVVAYDALYDILNTDVAKWYNTLLPDKNSKVSLREFRDSFFEHFEIEQEEIELVNDSMTVEKTIEPEELSGKTVINAICEANGCFGRIGRNGKFKYIYLEQSIEGLYPAIDLYPSENLYPKEPKGEIIGSGTYIPPLSYEGYTVKSITGLHIRQEENDLAIEVGTSENPYVIEGNFLLYGKSSSVLKEIAENILGKITSITYRPFSTKAKGNPLIEVGDAVRLNTKTQRIESYVLQRTLTGIQALRDDYTADGTEYQPKKVNSVQRDIQQLKGKNVALEKYADSILLSVEDLESYTKSEIRLLEDEISLKVDADGVISSINLSEEGVKIKASKIQLEGYTTINGNFSIDLNGNASLKTDDGYIEMDGYNLKVIRNDVENGGYYGASAIKHFDIQWMTVVNAGTEDATRSIMLGTPSKKIENGYFKSINGYTPITSGNIDNYIDLSDLEDRITDLEDRISSLEGGE